MFKQQQTKPWLALWRAFLWLVLLTLTAVSIFTGGRDTSDQRGAEDLSREGFNPRDYDRYSWWVGGLWQGQLKAGVRVRVGRVVQGRRPRTPPYLSFRKQLGGVQEQSRAAPGPIVWQTRPLSVPLTYPPLSLLSDRTLACRCSTTCRQTLSFWLAGWHCWRRSSGQVTLRHPHPQLLKPMLTFFSLGDKLKTLKLYHIYYTSFFLAFQCVTATCCEIADLNIENNFLTVLSLSSFKLMGLTAW